MRSAATAADDFRESVPCVHRLIAGYRAVAISSTPPLQHFGTAQNACGSGHPAPTLILTIRYAARRGAGQGVYWTRGWGAGARFAQGPV
jgi:hypothetical protein